MGSKSAEISVVLPRAWTGVVVDFLALSKPRVVAMVLATTVVGFHLGATAATEYWLLVRVLLGTVLAAAGTLALNQYLERDRDARMERTRARPLPSGRLQPIDALAFGTLTTVAGLAVLCFAVNPVSGAVTATIVATYLFAYTPMKVRSPLCSLVGAVPGALPPVTGWVAARGELGAGAWVLFAILFLWQLPHSLAIARLYADDYARAGFRLLPIVDAGGHSTERLVVGHCAALLVVGLMPTLLGLTGPRYFIAALFLGTTFLVCGLRMAWVGTESSARAVLLASLVYLPLLLAAMAADKAPL